METRNDAQSTAERPAPFCERVSELQIRLEELAGLARCVASTVEEPELNGPLCVIAREIEAVCAGLDDLIPGRSLALHAA